MYEGEKLTGTRRYHIARSYNDYDQKRSRRIILNENILEFVPVLRIDRYEPIRRKNRSIKRR